MLHRLVKLSLLPFALQACSYTLEARLYPIEGPMSKQRPLPVLTAEAKGNAMDNVGTISLTLPDGEHCTGEWSSARTQSTTVVFGNTETLTGSTAGGTSGAAVLTCDKGRTIDFEFQGDSSRHGFGAGKDSEGNKFKVIF